MTVSRRSFQVNQQIEIGTYSFETVQEFAYLGTCLTSKNEIRPEIEKEFQQLTEHIMHFTPY
jgi:hypothetical protein